MANHTAEKNIKKTTKNVTGNIARFLSMPFVTITKMITMSTRAINELMKNPAELVEAYLIAFLLVIVVLWSMLLNSRLGVIFALVVVGKWLHAHRYLRIFTFVTMFIFVFTMLYLGYIQIGHLFHKVWIYSIFGKRFILWV